MTDTLSAPAHLRAENQRLRTVLEQNNQDVLCLMVSLVDHAEAWLKLYKIVERTKPLLTPAAAELEGPPYDGHDEDHAYQAEAHADD